MRKRIGAGLFLLIFVFLTMEGKRMKVEDFDGRTPTFVLENYFRGRTRASGILFARNGDVKRSFTVDMLGTWKGNLLVLEEDFVFSDGETQHRTWTVKKLDDHTYEGTAGDVIGVARGKQFGSALNWSYILRVPVSGKTYDISFDDWMFLTPDGVLLNRATMRKFGFRVGELFLAFQQIPEAQASAS